MFINITLKRALCYNLNTLLIRVLLCRKWSQLALTTVYVCSLHYNKDIDFVLNFQLGVSLKATLNVSS